MGGAAPWPRRGREEAVSYQLPPDDEAGTAAGLPPGGFQDQDERAVRRWYGSQWGQQTQPFPRWQEPQLPYPPPQPYGQPSFEPDPQYGPPPGQPPYQGPLQYPPPSYDRDPYRQAQLYGQQPWPPPRHHGRPAWTSWPRRHKVLTVLGGLVALIIIASTTSGGNAKQAGDASTVATTPTHTATASQMPTHQATKKKAKPRKTPVTVQATVPAPTATAPVAAPAPPPATAPAVARSSSAATTPAGCYPLSNENTCYQPGERCRAADHGESGIAGDGTAITCQNNHGWRWEPS
jgi:hypothetical protein